MDLVPSTENFCSYNNYIEQVVQSTEEDCGISVTIFGLNEHIKNNRLRYKVGLACNGVNLDTERVVAIRAAQAGKDFLPLKNDPHVAVMPCNAYLKLLELVVRYNQNVCNQPLESFRGLNTPFLGNGIGNSSAFVRQCELFETPSKVRLVALISISTDGNYILRVNLTWSDKSLGNLHFTWKPLDILAKDLPILKSWLVDRGPRASITFGRHHHVSAAAARKRPMLQEMPEGKLFLYLACNDPNGKFT